MRISYYNHKRVLMLDEKEVKSLLTSIDKMEQYIRRIDSDLPEQIRPYASINGQEAMKKLAEMEEFAKVMFGTIFSK